MKVIKRSQCSNLPYFISLSRGTIFHSELTTTVLNNYLEVINSQQKYNNIRTITQQLFQTLNDNYLQHFLL